MSKKTTITKIANTYGSMFALFRNEECKNAAVLNLIPYRNKTSEDLVIHDEVTTANIHFFMQDEYDRR
ncbi:hypothetical protein CHS0354_014880 [Potamilus streckersoni]|uniref:Uncharacterized protein n=1 Tax=Potamilus streckersoni TaxID=2493646 RepID=A0AAE0TIQ6_9BIVA|nr:hypothetical protein CHS0354_014880 [Potamilus streckersoni]